MADRIIAPYGSWKSPIDARKVAEGTIGLMEPQAVGEFVFWTEMRPVEGGRYVVVRRGGDGRAVDVVPPPFNARTRVHEYGGGAYWPCGQGVVFANFADQRLYRATGDGAQPVPVTTADGLRYADFTCDTRRSRLIAVREDHRGSGEAANTIAAVYPHGRGGGGCDGQAEADAGQDPDDVLVAGSDFFSSPRLSPDGTALAWLSWNHPNMPWDSTELWVAPVNEDGTLGPASRVAGGPGEAIVQPEWSPDGVLYFVSDRTDWWNIYRLGGLARENGDRHRNGGNHAVAEPVPQQVTDLAAEFGGAAWAFGGSFYAFASPSRIICTYIQDGLSHLASVDVASRRLEEIATPCTTIRNLRAGGGRAVFLGGSATRPTAVVCMDLATGKTEELRRSTETQIDAGYLSAPQPVEFPTTGGLTSHGLFYEPANQDYAAPAGEAPPLLVMVHGGPTSTTSSALRAGIQYYTSRGVAVLDVNYGGSTGYGRRYRQRLAGQWGVVDVEDCCNGALHLAAAGRVDGRRLAITGGSAGGYTVLACLAFRHVFAAGASHFGVSDCEALAVETHKFESRYLDGLIGPYPRRRDLYVQRSPIHHVEGLSCPVVFFQGLEDKIVPPNQARRMADALRAKGVPVALVEFPGEQHGFRQAENIRRAMEGELYFLSRIFGFRPADELEPLEIENLEPRNGR